ncbi:unnamed protein product [Lepeophtheirus salmonis]|uniref:(salmon louse) hypothetical protein n=1 Tax=Lepeophtheirus salmonis TaxID=72036 RepID=A0A7R8H651_LEPSM|nr:unnamed protein product [Lepeophtheirus salmonis]CAF2881217.1 unnamed protein product [Lepeophtheirus salmonis]
MTNIIAEKILNSDSWKWAFEPKKPELLTDKNFIYSRDSIMDKHQVPNHNFADSVNMRSMEPIFTNVISDLSFLANSIRTSKCTKFELSAMECYEYYGMRKGLDLCKDYFEDYVECTQNTKQLKRISAIRKQMNKRYLEYLAGKREYKDLYRSHPIPFAYYEPDRENENMYRKFA